MSAFDAFVVAHGTDTMHFSASAVAFALGSGLNKPVVFTGAQTAPEVLHGDARVNLIRAFKVALENLAEVAICFGDFVFRATRTQKKDERKFDAIESPSFSPIGYSTEDILLTGLARKTRDPPEELNFRPFFASGVAQFSLIPGLEPELIRTVIESPTCNGLILQSFGAGNIPTEGPFSLLNLIEYASALGKPSIVTSQFPANATAQSTYETGLAAVKAGAITTGNMTASCAAAKFRWVLANVDRDIKLGLVDLEDRLPEISRRMQFIFVEEMDRPRVR